MTGCRIPREELGRVARCVVTGNPCGTDTRPVRGERIVGCLCVSCVAWSDDRALTLEVRCEDIRAVCHSCAHLDPLESLGSGENASWWHGMSKCVAGPLYARLLADGHALEDVVRKVKEAK